MLIYLSSFLFICVSNCLFDCLSSLSVGLFYCISCCVIVLLCVYLFVCPISCLIVCLSVCLAVSLNPLLLTFTSRSSVWFARISISFLYILTFTQYFSFFFLSFDPVKSR